MGELVVLEKNEIYTTSMIISENLKILHENVVKLIRKYSYIEELTVVERRKHSTKGRSIIEYLLTESQALLLVSLMKNTPEVINFKINLIKAFIKYRNIAAKLMVQQQNQEWILKREETKVARKDCTDVIQQFVMYAKSQGSKSAEKYFMNFSRMELTGLFLIEQKFPNFRDVMNFRQLNLIEVGDEVIANSLKDSMNKMIPYKECYLLAKQAISTLASLMPKTPLPSLLESGKQNKLLTKYGDKVVNKASERISVKDHIDC